MSSLPRREVGELIAKYELHPELIDIFVEGDFDRDFLTCLHRDLPWFSVVTVTPVEDVDVPNGRLEHFGLQLGSNKSRVIALARDLGESSAYCTKSNFLCVIDRDLDDALGRIIDLPGVAVTDYTSMELYLLNSQVLGRFFELTANLNQRDMKTFLSLADRILRVQFGYRVAMAKLGINHEIPEFSAGLCQKGDLNSFDAARYQKRLIEKHNLHSDLVRIEQEVQAHPWSLDLRKAAHGHDFISLLFEFVWSKGRLRLHDKGKSVIEFGGRILASATQLADVSAEGLFKTISQLERRV